MTYFIDKNEFLTKAEMQKKIFSDFISMSEGFIKIINSFDGKVINIRIQKELQKYISENFNGYSVRVEANYTFIIKSFKSGFISSELLIIPALKDEKRIEAAGTIEYIQKLNKNMDSKIKEIESYIENFDNYRQMTEKILNEIETYEKNVPYLLRPYITIQEKKI